MSSTCTWLFGIWSSGPLKADKCRCSFGPQEDSLFAIRTALDNLEVRTRSSGGMRRCCWRMGRMRGPGKALTLRSCLRAASTPSQTRAHKRPLRRARARIYTRKPEHRRRGSSNFKMYLKESQEGQGGSRKVPHPEKLKYTENKTG